MNIHMIHGYELREKTILIHPILNFTFENVERRFLFHVQVPRFQTPLTWFRLFYYLYIIVRGTVTVKIYLQCTKIPMKLKKNNLDQNFHLKRRCEIKLWRFACKLSIENDCIKLFPVALKLLFGWNLFIYFSPVYI